MLQRPRRPGELRYLAQPGAHGRFRDAEPQGAQLIEGGQHAGQVVLLVVAGQAQLGIGQVGPAVLA